MTTRACARRGLRLTSLAADRSGTVPTRIPAGPVGVRM